jgi:Rhodopirellula transposase DDE domain
VSYTPVSLHKEEPLMELTPTLITLFMATAARLKGSARRLFMAEIVQTLGRGGQRAAERLLGWNRASIRLGQQELHAGRTCAPAYRARGRKPAEAHLPHLLADIRALVDGQSQTDPQFKSTRLYTRLTAAEVRRQLSAQKGYSDTELPSVSTIGRKLNALGYQRRRVQKTRPKKKLPQTDAIFEQVQSVNAAADAAPDTLRLSLDAKATVVLGEFDRGGTTRVPTEALDHDFAAGGRVTPVGLLLPQRGALFLYTVRGPVTSDCLADIVAQWWEQQRVNWPEVRRLVLNVDNGPEVHSGRTQWMGRLVEFTQQTGLGITLAYYPPYHSKYNPIERCWGVLERHWDGALLGTAETVERWLGSMTWKGRVPVVQRIEQVYHKGVRLSKQAMKVVEAQIQRHATLGKWSVDIPAPAPVLA